MLSCIAHCLTWLWVLDFLCIFIVHYNWLRDFCLFQHSETRSGARWTSYSMGTGVCTPRMGVKTGGAWIWPLTSISLPGLEWLQLYLCSPYITSWQGREHLYLYLYKNWSVGDYCTQKHGEAITDRLVMPVTYLVSSSLVFSSKAGFGRNQSPVRRPVWLWHTAF